jgi:hypothetical protein
MALNIKLWGLKYNFRKVQGCFCKIPSVGHFQDLLNYFSTEKGWINLGRWFFLGCSDFNENEGYSHSNLGP